jgi:hypothetical protein
MQVVSCPAPLGALEPAPLTCLPLDFSLGAATATAYWSGDDEYYVLVDGCDQADSAVTGWYRVDHVMPPVEPLSAAEAERMAAEARQMLDVIPMGCGQVTFPVGSTGRTVYRVWRSRARSGTVERSFVRTRILGVRAGRSLRRPA